MRAQEFAESKLVIFDIDDTLVNTDTKVNVVKDGRVIKQLNSHDFTHYHLQPGEQFDFGAFKDAREFYTRARPIPGMIRQLKQDIATGNKVIMLTARSDFNDREVFLDTFRKYGIDMDRVHVYRAGNLSDKVSTEQKKKIILQHLLGKTHYDKIIMYDDSVPNLNAFLSLKQDYPWSRFYAWHVDPSGRADEYHRTDRQLGESAPAGTGPIRAYHGTFQPEIERFQPLSHFGTQAAAEERLRFRSKREGINQPGRIYQVTLDIKNPFRVRDFAGRHSATHFAFDLRQAGLIDQEEMLAITSLAGDPRQGQALIRKLRELGFDGMVYRNRYEDAGSTSYVILGPKQVISVKRAAVSESLMVEYRRGVMDILRDELPDWPDYVIKDWIYQKIQSPIDLEGKLNHVRAVAQMVQPNSWRLQQKMPLTFDMLSPKTRYSMKTKRQFGDRNPFMIPRDRERLEQAIELVKTKGMENLPPVIMLRQPDGLELVEGWHRTMAAFRLYPEGFRVNAWIGDAA